MSGFPFTTSCVVFAPGMRQKIHRRPSFAPKAP
jgi:hypothetical protein